MTAAQSAAKPDQPGRPAEEALRYVVPDSLPEHTGPRSQEVMETNGRADLVPGTQLDILSLKLSIIILAYNDETTIARAIGEVLRIDYPCAVELIVVDDGSTDQTWRVISSIEDKRVVMHRHDANQGKGAALRSALSLATGSYVIPFDADLQYNALDIPRILAPVLTGRCDVVYGTRLFGCNTVYQSYWHALGNRMLTRLANVLFGAYLSDLNTCFKLLPLATLRELPIGEQGHGLDTEMTALLLKRGIRPFEVPVSYISRSLAQGKKISWRDGMVRLGILLRVRMQSESSRGRNRRTDGAESDQQPLPEAG